MKKQVDFLYVWYRVMNMNGGYDPRQIVKDNAIIYRDSEERRIDFERYYAWLAVHEDKKVLTDKETLVNFVNNEDHD